ncbi:uncharacterized protein [Cicer arietinum]|uniref:uncharacterized protein n=1 Tax=Cicer arietinum TaxID=3827 RepID=UPI003CC5C3F7
MASDYEQSSSSSMDTSEHKEPSPLKPNLTLICSYQHDMLDPYFMHPNDNPSDVVVSPQLSTTNYHSWLRSMIVALKSKNKLGFVTCSLPCPADVDRLPIAWDRCNTMLMHHQGDVFRIFDLQKIFIVFVKICEYRDGDYVIRFLKGLKEQYSAIQSQLMLRDHLTSINKVFSMLVQQERHLFPNPKKSPIIAAISNPSGGLPKSRGESGARSSGSRGHRSRYCTHCNFHGHTMDFCFQKHGFPRYFHKNGHNSAKVCVVDSVKTDDDQKSQSLDEPSSDLHSGFTLEHQKSLLSLLHPSSSVNHLVNSSQLGSYFFPHVFNINNVTSWILDTRATNHVCFTASLFQSLKCINYVRIKFPNGCTIITVLAGTVYFTTSFDLCDVLFIPKFSCNLIFIPCLTTSLNCNLFFNAHKCWIYDNLTQKRIGYVCNIRHHRFGHPFIDTLTHISKIFPFVTLLKRHSPSDSPTIGPHSDSLIQPSSPIILPNFGVSTSRITYVPNQSSPSMIPTRKSGRKINPPSYLQDYHCELLTGTRSKFVGSSIQNSGIIYPISNYFSYDQLSSPHRIFSLTISTIKETSSYNTAIKDKNWRLAIQYELDALNSNDTWELTIVPPNKSAIGCKWIFKLKFHVDGSIECYKAQLVAKGFSQTEGLDYLETSSLVVKMTTLRLLLSVTTSNNWFLFQLDIYTAFIHGDLVKDVYMKIPLGVLCYE